MECYIFHHAEYKVNIHIKPRTEIGNENFITLGDIKLYFLDIF